MKQLSKPVKNDKLRIKSHPSFMLPLLGLLGGLLAAFLYVSYKPLPAQLGNIPIIATTPTPSPTPGPNPISVLLLGYGGPDHDGGYLSDTIIEAVVQPEQKRILMLTIPRDLAVSIPISDTQVWEDKVNAAFAIGIDDRNYPNKPKEYKASTNPGALAKKMVGNVTGYPIDNYIALSFDGFIRAIDTLGGVDVHFTQSFDDYKYPIRGKENDTCGFTEEDIATISAAFKGEELESQFTCRYEHLHVSIGTQHLNGETALKVARSRHSAETKGDFSRSERQKAIIQAAKEKVFKIGFLPKAIPFFMSLGKDLKTDIDVGFLTSLLPFAQELRSYKIISIAFSTDNVLNEGYNERGQYVLTPKTGTYNWTGIHEFIKDEIAKNEATSSATLQSH